MPNSKQTRQAGIDINEEAMVARVKAEFEARSAEPSWSDLGSHLQAYSDELHRRFQGILEMHYSVIRDHLALQFRHIFAVYVKNFLYVYPLRVLC